MLILIAHIHTTSADLVQVKPLQGMSDQLNYKNLVYILLYNYYTRLTLEVMTVSYPLRARGSQQSHY